MVRYLGTHGKFFGSHHPPFSPMIYIREYARGVCICEGEYADRTSRLSCIAAQIRLLSGRRALKAASPATHVHTRSRTQAMYVNSQICAATLSSIYAPRRFLFKIGSSWQGGKGKGGQINISERTLVPSMQKSSDSNDLSRRRKQEKADCESRR